MRLLSIYQPLVGKKYISLCQLPFVFCINIVFLVSDLAYNPILTVCDSSVQILNLNSYKNSARLVLRSRKILKFKVERQRKRLEFGAHPKTEEQWLHRVPTLKKDTIRCTCLFCFPLAASLGYNKRR